MGGALSRERESKDSECQGDMVDALTEPVVESTSLSAVPLRVVSYGEQTIELPMAGVTEEFVGFCMFVVRLVLLVFIVVLRKSNRRVKTARELVEFSVSKKGERSGVAVLAPCDARGCSQEHMACSH